MGPNETPSHAGNVIVFQIAAAVLWGVLGACVALTALPDINDDARIIVGVLSVALPGASIGAALALHRRRPTLGVVLLLVSVLTPTYLAWPLNLMPLLVAASIPLSRPRGSTKPTPHRSPDIGP